MTASEGRVLSPTFPLTLLPSLLFGYLAALSLVAPIAEEYGLYALSHHCYSTLSHICHQYPTRCLWVVNRPMGLCSRCFSVYASFSLSLLFLPQPQRKRTIGLSCLLFLPLTVDALLQYCGIRESVNLLRVISGISFGGAASLLYRYGAVSFVSMLKALAKRRKTLSAYEYSTLIIGGVLICLVNLYGIAACAQLRLYS
jgi:uncharacterized membrane protein